MARDSGLRSWWASVTRALTLTLTLTFTPSLTLTLTLIISHFDNERVSYVEKEER